VISGMDNFCIPWRVVCSWFFVSFDFSEAKEKLEMRIKWFGLDTDAVLPKGFISNVFFSLLYHFY
jgi:hypothetical protein